MHNATLKRKCQPGPTDIQTFQTAPNASVNLADTLKGRSTTIGCIMYAGTSRQIQLDNLGSCLKLKIKSVYCFAIYEYQRVGFPCIILESTVGIESASKYHKGGTEKIKNLHFSTWRLDFRPLETHTYYSTDHYAAALLAELLNSPSVTVPVVGIGQLHAIRVP